MIVFRIYYILQGGHVHMRMFVARGRGCPCWGKCGDFTMQEDEFEAFKVRMWDRIEFIREGELAKGLGQNEQA